LALIETKWGQGFIKECLHSTIHGTVQKHDFKIQLPKEVLKKPMEASKQYQLLIRDFPYDFVSSKVKKFLSEIQETYWHCG